jgi:hypothetical protein
MPKFAMLFDTCKFSPYLNIKYVSESSDEGKLVYESYKPSNSVDMREYICFLIAKKLRKLPDSYKVSLGKGFMENLSNKLLRFLQERDI